MKASKFVRILSVVTMIIALLLTTAQWVGAESMPDEEVYYWYVNMDYAISTIRADAISWSTANPNSRNITMAPQIEPMPWWRRAGIPTARARAARRIAFWIQNPSPVCRVRLAR